MALINLQPGARADSVYLHAQAQTVTSVLRFVGTNSQDGFTYVDRTEDSSTYTYLHGETYTNHIWQDYQEDRTYSTGYKDNVPGHTRILSTNSASAPWVNGGLDYGTQRDFGTYVQHRWWTNILISNWINSSWDVPSSNYLATYDDSGEWPMAGWSYSVTNYSAGETSEREETANVTSIARLATSGGTNGSALFCLTGSVNDLSLGLPFPVPLTSGWTIASNAPDANGRVFLILGNGTTNDATVKLDDSLTNSVTNWNYSVGASRVDLGMQWKGPNDTNWHSDWPLYVLKDTTVQFRVTTPGFTNVGWPAGFPQWSNGSNGVTQISMNFNSVSSDTNGQWVSVTAGTTASNRVVVFDYDVKFQPAEGLGQFAGRAAYPTVYGVGEDVVFVALTDPAGLSISLNWNATGMHAGGNLQDRSLYTPSSTDFKAGAFEETNLVTATLSGAPSSGSSRSNTFSVIRPTSAVLKDLSITNVPFLGFPGGLPYLVSNTNVGHDINTETCWKKSLYFILPQTVSFHGIQVREGAGPYTLGNGLFTIPQDIPTNGTFTFTSDPWRPPSLTSGPLVTTSVSADAQHTPGTPRNCSHQVHLATGATDPNYLHWDRFGIIPPGNPNLPYPLPHQSVRLCDLVGRIPIEFQLNSGTFYHIADVSSRREFYSDATLVIDKAGSGPHSKAFASPSTPEE